MSQANADTACTCGNQACAVRTARGLKPFCQIQASAPEKPAGYSSRSACLAAHPGQDVFCRSIGGMGHGMRWYPVMRSVA